MNLKPPYENRDNSLYIDSVPTNELAETYGTPLYVYSEKRIKDNYRRLRDTFTGKYSKSRILYAAKANSNLAVLRILKEEGAMVDTVSPGEVYLAIEAGFTPDQILFTGTSVSQEELNYLISTGVKVNADSISQLDKILKMHVPEMLSIRLNPQLGAGHHEHVITAGPDVKFGVWEKDALKMFEKAAKAGVKRFGIHMHIGSGIMNPEHHIRAGEKLLEVAKNVREATGISLEFIDFGGGIGVSYRPEEDEVDLNEYSKRIVGFFKSKIDEYSLGEPELWWEPGRYIVANAGILLTRVTTIKKTPNRNFLGVDAGFNTLLRPVLYGAYHHILLTNRLEGPLEKYDVYGPLCESGDFLGREREIPRTSEGDLLALMTTGAYGYSMSSQYNSRPRPAEVMVKNGSTRLIRERETFADLTKGQPSHR